LAILGKNMEIDLKRCYFKINQSLQNKSDPSKYEAKGRSKKNTKKLWNN
jgi:hypothetical protein